MRNSDAWLDSASHAGLSERKSCRGELREPLTCRSLLEPKRLAEFAPPNNGLFKDGKLTMQVAGGGEVP